MYVRYACSQSCKAGCVFTQTAQRGGYGGGTQEGEAGREGGGGGKEGLRFLFRKRESIRRLENSVKSHF